MMRICDAMGCDASLVQLQVMVRLPLSQQCPAMPLRDDVDVQNAWNAVRYTSSCSLLIDVHKQWMGSGRTSNDRDYLDTYSRILTDDQFARLHIDSFCDTLGDAGRC